MMLIVDVVQDGEENGAPGGGFNQAEDNSQVPFHCHADADADAEMNFFKLVKCRC